MGEQLKIEWKYKIADRQIRGRLRTARPMKMRPIGYQEMSVINHKSTLRKIPE